MRDKAWLRKINYDKCYAKRRSLESSCVCLCRLMIGQYVTVFGDVISHVNISMVKPEDGGEYECVAENRAGRISHAARLNVYGKS